MKIKFVKLLLIALTLFGPRLNAATSVSQYGITWTFDHDYPAGQFCNGDYWVVGPVQVVGITTSLHAPAFSPKPGEDGSMVNPGTTDKQGYDNRLKSYDASLNAALVNGQPVSPKNPLALKPNSSLVSMVSWIYRSPQDAEPGIPRFNGGTKAPRPVTRSGAVLTVLPAPAPKGSFRPPYAGADKTVKYNAEKLDRSKLKNLAPVAGMPDVALVEKQMERPWIDHVYEYLGAMVHPSENMPNYGREMTQTMNQAALLLHVDFSRLPGNPSKEKLLIEFVQYGIDLAGIADNGGGWPNNGGHLMGRKWPILFAGLMLNDEHMKSAGQWKTKFQEDQQTFYVSKTEVDITHSAQWKPDPRLDPATPYETADIGMPEWGINHASNPASDKRTWHTVYRAINGCVYPGFVLAARIMGQETAWNHQALFDYTDRYIHFTGGKDHAEAVDPFILNMWNKYNPGFSRSANAR
jgi:hypothetical protein